MGIACLIYRFEAMAHGDRPSHGLQKRGTSGAHSWIAPTMSAISRAEVMAERNQRRHRAPRKRQTGLDKATVHMAVAGGVTLVILIAFMALLSGHPEAIHHGCTYAGRGGRICL
jgi:hypothetical protein